jgi:hypothetical protein
MVPVDVLLIPLLAVAFIVTVESSETSPAVNNPL